MWGYLCINWNDLNYSFLHREVWLFRNFADVFNSHSVNPLFK